MKIEDLKRFIQTLYKDLNILQEREAKYGGEPPLALVNQINAYQQAISLSLDAIAYRISPDDLLEKLRPLPLEESLRVQFFPSPSFTQALKIFIGSVFDNFKPAKQTLKDEIHKLQELFVGIEYFDSGPDQLAEDCVQKVKDADLYIGLFGDDDDLVDKQSRKSFAELEYNAARTKKIPCLIRESVRKLS